MIYADSYKIIKISINEEDCYKVFATFRGGYLSGDSWRLNSGITNIEKDGDNYIFTGCSGSSYTCRKDMYGTSFYTESILLNLEEKANGKIKILSEEEAISFIRSKT